MPAPKSPALATQFTALTRLTSRPYNIHFFCHTPPVPFGLPTPNLVDRVHGWDTQISASTTTVEEARWPQAHEADGVIAQGLEAGCHRGHFLNDDLSTCMGTVARVPQPVATLIPSSGRSTVPHCKAQRRVTQRSPICSQAAQPAVSSTGSCNSRGQWLPAAVSSPPLWAEQNASNCRALLAADITQWLAQGFPA